MGSLSLASSETQARGQAPRSASADQAWSRVVLPQPAGAAIKVSGPRMAACIRCVSRGRGTICRRAGGIEIFVVSRWRSGVLAAEEDGASRVAAVSLFALPQARPPLHEAGVGRADGCLPGLVDHRAATQLTCCTSDPGA